MQERHEEFAYYLNSMLQQLSGLYPDCFVTLALAEKISEATKASDSESIVKMMDQWKTHMDKPELKEAIKQGNFDVLVNSRVPIFDLMQIQSKLKDGRLSGRSRETLLRFVQTLQEIIFREEMTGESCNNSNTQLDIQFPTKSNLNSMTDQLPPEMAPLIDLARSFIQKMPEDEVNQMFGNIASIGQTVMRNYSGDIPSELGGNYFADVLKKTFQ
jgi:hypothetical protein